MGEYAEMMLDGTCCSSCGELLGGPEDWEDPQGFPGLCPSCAEGMEETFAEDTDDGDFIITRKPFGCAICRTKWFQTKQAVKDHARAKHGVAS